MELSNVAYFKLLDRLADYHDKDGKVITSPLVKGYSSTEDIRMMKEDKSWLND